MPYHSYYILFFETNVSEVFLSVPAASSVEQTEIKSRSTSFSPLVDNCVLSSKYQAPCSDAQLTTLGPRGYFFSYLIPNSLRDCESQSAKRKRERVLSTVSTVYFILGILRTDLWIGQSICSPNWRVQNSEEFESLEGRLPPPGRGGDARRKFWLKPLKETDLGVAQAFLDP